MTQCFVAELPPDAERQEPARISVLRPRNDKLDQHQAPCPDLGIASAFAGLLEEGAQAWVLRDE